MLHRIKTADQQASKQASSQLTSQAAARETDSRQCVEEEHMVGEGQQGGETQQQRTTHDDPQMHTKSHLKAIKSSIKFEITVPHGRRPIYIESIPAAVKSLLSLSESPSPSLAIITK